MSFRVLAVLVLGCCLVSTVAAFNGGCSSCSAQPAGGWGSPSTGAYWGLSLEDIMNVPVNPGTTDSGPWTPPELVLPTSNAGKFASLADYISTSGGTPLVPGKYSGTGTSDIMTKPFSKGETASPFSSLSISSGQIPKSGGIYF